MLTFFRSTPTFSPLSRNGKNVNSGIDFTLILGYNFFVLFEVKK